MVSISKINKLVGLVSVNSIDYIEKLFNLYESDQTAVLIKNKVDGNEVNGIILNYILEPAHKTGWFSPKSPSSSNEEIAQISFTSGTEGEPKAIAISHQALDNTASRLVKVLHMDQTIKEYIGAPVNFSFGLGRCRAIAVVGGIGYLPPNGFDPLEISKMLANNEINAVSAVPTLWRVILENKKYFKDIGSNLRWIEIGSQYMSRDEKIDLRDLFPKAKIIQHYGLTEASRTTFLDISNETDALESVGKPSQNIEVKLNEENKICIKGPHLCTGMITDGKVKSLTDKGGWFETSDFGEIKDGYLYYKGRADDVINCGGIKISPEILEREMRISLTTNIGLCISKISDKERGEIPLIAILKESSHQQEVIEKIALKELNVMGLRLASLPFLIIDEFPITATGKLQRKKISSQYKSPISTETKKKRKTTTSVREIFEDMFGAMNLNNNPSFDLLGGDSLNYVNASIQLEDHLGYLPKEWNQLSLSTLESCPIAKSKLSNVETNILLRSIAILAIVLGHSGFTFISGGAQLLFILVGYNLARFQSKSFIQGYAWNSIYKFSIKLLVPYFIIVLSYFYWKNAFGWERIFLYTNYIPFEGRSPSIFPTWFILVLIQSLVIIGLIFSSEKLRDMFRINAWKTSFLVLLFFIILRVAFPFLYDTNFLFERVAPIYIASIWLGWVIYFSETLKQKWSTFTVAMTLSFVHLGLNPISLWISAGSFMLLFIENVKLPYILKYSLTRIAAASFFIYLFHMIFIHVPANIFKLNSSIINSLFGVYGSVLLWYLFQRLDTQKIFNRVSKLNWIKTNKIK